MQQYELDKLDSAPVDETTKAAIEEALAEFERGDGVTLEQSTINLKKRLKAWRKAKEELTIAA